MENTWIVHLEQDGDELILPIPEELMTLKGWNIGDVLNMSLENEKIIITLAGKND